MSKPAKANPSAVQETSVESASGASNTKENSMSPHDLLKLNVNEHTEKKNGLTYLSWAWAWQEALKQDPAATFHVQTFGDKPYMDVNGTGMVWVDVTLGGKTRTCWLPVMDYKDVEALGKYITEKGKILPRRITRLNSKDQRTLTRLIKKSRHSGLLAFQAN